MARAFEEVCCKVEAFGTVNQFKVVWVGGFEMKVESLQAFPISMKAKEKLQGGTSTYSHYQTVLVKAVCDGVTGWGEAMTRSEPKATALLVKHLSTMILESNVVSPSQAWEKVWRELRIRGHTRGTDVEALSGIEIALYDCFGKIVRKPIAKILDHQPLTRVPVYAGSLFASRGSLKSQVEVAKGAEMLGAKVKIGFGLAEDLRTLEEARRAWPEGRLVADANGAYDAKSALKACALFRKLELSWFEEPVVSDDWEGYARLKGKGVPIGGGEAWFVNELTKAAEKKLVDVVEPSVSRCGGIGVESMAAKAAVKARLGFSPMVGMNSAVSLAASMQVAAAFGSVGIEANPFQNPLQTELTDSPFRAKRGAIELPAGFGLGIEVLEEFVRRNAG